MKILAYLETFEGSFKKTAYEAVTAAHALAAQVGGSVVGVAFNANASAAAAYGLSDCIVVENEALAKHSSAGLATALAEIAQAEGASVVIVPASSRGKEIAPRVAVKLQAGFVADVVEFACSSASFVVKKPVYAGKAIASMSISTDVKVVTIRPNIFTPKTNEATLSTRSFNSSVTAAQATAQVQSVSRQEGKLDVAEADKIVSGGRGLKGPEHFYLVENLAKAIGAAVGASRAVVDAGWRPHNEQVGQTGKTVSPSLYVACGISGAVQHLAGMSTSKVIVAINKDKDAPIFQVADYGLVADADRKSVV